jgi:xylulokinase
MGVMLSAAGSLRWLRDALGGGPDYPALIAEAEAWAPGTEGLTFLPYLAGERTPHADPGARGAFAGLTLRHDRGALARAVLEGVAYGLRDSLDLLRDVGVQATVGRVSGGGSRSDAWLRIVASALELPLERTAVDEGRGLRRRPARRGGHRGFADAEEAVRACVRTTGAIEPEPALVDAYAEGIGRYRALYPALRDVPPDQRRDPERRGAHRPAPFWRGTTMGRHVTCPRTRREAVPELR